MALPPLGGVNAVQGINGTQGVGGAGGVGGAPGAGGAGAVGGAPEVDFSQALDAVAALEHQADGLAAQAATGQLQDVHTLMAAQAKAALAVELTVAVRDQAVAAYQEVMRMQI